MRPFHLIRDTDPTGIITGTGIVADGVIWSDGTTTIRWRGHHPSTVHWNTLHDAMVIHGHGGHTRVKFLDEDKPC